MKKILPFAMAAAAMIAPVMGQATSDPVGYVTLGNATSGQPSIAANTDVTFTVPFLNAVEANATVDSVAGSVITISTALTAAQFDAPATGAPFVIQVTSGAAEGLFAAITVNTDNTITVTGAPDSFANVVSGDTLNILQATTLGSLFAGNTIPDSTQVFAFDPTEGVNNSATATYSFFTPSWFNDSDFSNADDVILYPGESFIIRNNAATPIDSIVVSGAVPLSASRAILATNTTGAQDTRIGFTSPVDQSLSTLGLNAVVADGDQVLVFDNAAPGINKSASATYSYFAPSWFNDSDFSNADAVAIPGGAGIIFRRAAAGDGNDVEVSATPAYVSGL